MKVLLNRTNKALFIVGAALVLVMASIGGTLAWLTSSPGGLVNTFEPGRVPNEVYENGTSVGENGGTVNVGDSKGQVEIKNTGNVPAYIRVALVPVWRYPNGDGTGVAPDSIELQFDENGPWMKSGDYYYHKSPVLAGNLTAPLFSSYAKPALPEALQGIEGVYFELQILSQSIQADGMGAANAQAAFARAAAATTANP